MVDIAESCTRSLKSKILIRTVKGALRLIEIRHQKGIEHATFGLETFSIDSPGCIEHRRGKKFYNVSEKTPLFDFRVDALSF